MRVVAAQPSRAGEQLLTDRLSAPLFSYCDQRVVAVTEGDWVLRATEPLERAASFSREVLAPVLSHARKEAGVAETGRPYATPLPRIRHRTERDLGDVQISRKQVSVDLGIPAFREIVALATAVAAPPEPS